MTLYRGIEMHCFSLACIEEETYIMSCGFNVVEKRLNFVYRIFHQMQVRQVSREGLYDFLLSVNSSEEKIEILRV